MASGFDAMNALEAAAFLGAHVETLRKLARHNQIPAFEVGRDWRFRKSALNSWGDHRHDTSSEAVIGSDGLAPRSRDGSGGEALGVTLEALRNHLAQRSSRGAARLVVGGQESATKTVSREVRPGNLRRQIQTATRRLQTWLDCDAVGPRLRDGTAQRPLVTGHAPVLLVARPVSAELLGRTVQAAVGQAKSQTAEGEAP